MCVCVCSFGLDYVSDCYVLLKMSRSKISDLFGVLKGAQNVTDALVKHKKDAIKNTLIHSSLKDSSEKCLHAASEQLNNLKPQKIPVSFLKHTCNECQYTYHHSTYHLYLT